MKQLSGGNYAANDPHLKIVVQTNFSLEGECPTPSTRLRTRLTNSRNHTVGYVGGAKTFVASKASSNQSFQKHEPWGFSTLVEVGWTGYKIRVPTFALRQMTIGASIQKHGILRIQLFLK